MNGSALLFMAFSWGLVLSLTIFSFTRLFSAGRRKEGGGRKTGSGPPPVLI